MTNYVIAEPCSSHKDTNCLDVCPVDAIHPNRDSPDFATADRLHINAQSCIGCGSCFRVCTAKAIFEQAELPVPFAGYAQENSLYFQAAEQVSA